MSSTLEELVGDPPASQENGKKRKAADAASPIHKKKKKKIKSEHEHEAEPIANGGVDTTDQNEITIPESPEATLGGLNLHNGDPIDAEMPPPPKPEKKKKKKHRSEDLEGDTQVEPGNLTSDAPETQADWGVNGFDTIVGEQVDQNSTRKKERRKKKVQLEDEIPIASQDEDVKQIEDHELAQQPVDEEEVDQGAIPDDVPKPRKKKKRRDKRAEEAMNGEGVESSSAIIEDRVFTNLEEPPTPSPFHLIRLSLYVPLPAISVQSPLASLLASHIAPNLLTYFEPLRGILLAFSDPAISTSPPHTTGEPLPPPSSGYPPIHPTYQALAGDDFGVSWLWLTATFLVFRPQRGAEITGHLNICSEGYIGLSLYNYFQVSIAKSRIPKSWRWIDPSGSAMGPPTGKKRKGKKERINDFEEYSSQQTLVDFDHNADQMDLDFDFDDHTASNYNHYDSAHLSHFLTPSPHSRPVTGAVRFRVRDLDISPASGVNPATGRGKWTMLIEGTLLDDEAEKEARNEDREEWERSRVKSHRFEELPVTAVERVVDTDGAGDVVMSGGLGDRHRISY